MKWRILTLTAVFMALGAAAQPTLAIEALGLSEKHQKYGEYLYELLTKDDGYKSWQEGDADFDFGPQADDSAKSFLNSVAASNEGFPKKSCVVTEHYADGGLTGLTVRFHVGELNGKPYDPRNNNWYWAHFLPGGTIAKASPQKNPFAKPGFVTFEDDGRLWVFKVGSKELAQFAAEGEPAKIAIRPAAGPRGMTVKGPDQETLLTYILSTEGFHVSIDDGRVWVFREGSEALKQFREEGEPAKIVIRPAAGPLGLTVKGPDNETVDAFLRAFPQPPAPVSTEAPANGTTAIADPPATTQAGSSKTGDATKSVQAKFGKKGFFVKMDDGRLWVYREGSDELKQFQQDGEPAKISILPGAGPGGITLKGPDRDTLLGYIAAKEGFATFISDGRIWVFREGSEALESYKKDGEPAKIVVRPGAGPNGATLKGAKNETLDAYLKK